MMGVHEHKRIGDRWVGLSRYLVTRDKDGTLKVWLCEDYDYVSFDGWAWIGLYDSIADIDAAPVAEGLIVDDILGPEFTDISKGSSGFVELETTSPLIKSVELIPTTKESE